MSNEHPCKLTMLPAKDGDCFILEFGTGENLFRMMVDSGTVKFGNEKLKEYIRPLVEAGQKIDLLLITHFDRDHIGGALSLLRDNDLCGCVREIWHNGLRQIAPWLPEETDEKSREYFVNKNATMLEQEPAETGGTSAAQSKTLSQLIRTHNIKVNEFINGSAITEDTCSIRLGNLKDVEVFFLLPKQKRLEELFDLFEIELPLNVTPTLTEECEEGFDKFALHSDPIIVTSGGCSAVLTDPPDLDEWADEDVASSDPSPTNASSISIIIRYHDKKLLFPGDAIANDLVPALEHWLDQQRRDQQEENLLFDVVKLPHHGSNRNCHKLLDLDGFDGKLFLISTDGSKHGHPGCESLAKLVVRNPDQTKVLAFNYHHARYKVFSRPELQQQYHYLVTDKTDFPGFEVNATNE